VTSSVTGTQSGITVNAASLGATYYVSTTGSDSNAGTLTAPFLTINHAVGLLNPGDTLEIRAGTYAEVLKDVIPSGTSTAEVTVMAYPGETVTIQPSSSTDNLLTISSHSYITLKNLIFDGTNLTGGVAIVKITYKSSSVYASHITLSGCEIRNIPYSSSGNSQGILITKGSTTAAVDYNQVLNCTIHDNGGSTSTLNHGIYVETNHNTFANNTIYNNSAYGIQIYSGSATAGTTSYCSYNQIYGNTIYGEKTRSGIVISFGDSNQVYNNIIYGNADGGINLNNGSNNTQVYNNTIYNNSGGSGAAGINVDSGVTNAIIRNNISYLNGAGDYSDSGTGTTQDHNLFGTNPLFVNAAAGDFHLQAGSPAIDAGTTLTLVTTDIAGVTRDGPYEIGAYEYE
jgi:parallel beta-helix repeat protein